MPLADPLFASYTPLRIQVASLQETHIFSPQILNTFSVGFSRAAFNLASFPWLHFRQPFLCHRGRAWRDRRRRRGHNNHQRDRSLPRARTTPQASGITEICSRIRTICKSAKGFIRSASAYGFSGFRTTKTPLRAGRASHFCQPDDIPARNVSTFQVVPLHTELGWRSLFGAWYIEDSIRLRRNLTLQAGIRHEFTPAGMRRSEGLPTTSPTHRAYL